ncbi:MAG: heme exporter protein CcmD [Promethearchaeota archaeon]|jgi:hypothetical protein
MSVEFRDILTVSVSYALFWVIIVILILIPLFRLRKTLRRIDKLEKNLE